MRNAMRFLHGATLWGSDDNLRSSSTLSETSTGFELSNLCSRFFEILLENFDAVVTFEAQAASFWIVGVAGQLAYLTLDLEKLAIWKVTFEFQRHQILFD